MSSGHHELYRVVVYCFNVVWFQLFLEMYDSKFPTIYDDMVLCLYSTLVCPMFEGCSMLVIYDSVHVSIIFELSTQGGVVLICCRHVLLSSNTPGKFSRYFLNVQTVLDKVPLFPRLKQTLKSKKQIVSLSQFSLKK